MTGIELERTPNSYTIRVMRRGKCIDWVTYGKADEMVCWFNCLQFMKYGKKITEQGRRLFRREIASKVYEWKQEDEYMMKAQERYKATKIVGR